MPTWKSTPYFTRLLAFNLLLILVVGVVPLVVIFQYMMSAYSSELTKFNVQSVKQIQSVIDGQFLRPTVAAASRSLTETSVAEPPLLYPMTHPIRDAYSSIANITATLAAIEAELSFAGSVDIYYRDNDIFFYGNKSFCFVDEADCELGFRAQWLKEFLHDAPQVAWYTIDAADNPDREKLISYVRSYPYFAAPDKRKAIFAVNLKESAIRKQLTQSLNPANGLIFIVDGGGTVISSNGTAGDEADFQQASARWQRPAQGAGPPIANVKWEGTDAVAAFTPSEMNDWSYVTVVKKSVFYKRATDMRDFMYALGGAVLAVGAIVVYVLTKRAHRPIGRTLQEYSLQIDDLHDQLSKNEPVIKYHCVMNLLTGSGEAGADGSMTDMRRFLGLQLDEPYFVCFVLAPSASPDGESQSDVAAAYRLIERLEAADRPRGRIWAIVTPEGRICGIANGSDADGEAMEQALADEIARHMDQPCCLCLGNRYRTAEAEPAVSYREACEAISYAYFYPERSVIRYAELRAAERRMSGGSVKALDDLTDALRAGDGGKAQQAVRSVIAQTLSEQYAADYSRHLLMELVFTFRKTLKSLGIGTRELFGYDIRDYAERLRNVRQFSAWIEQATDIALRQIETRRRGVDTELDARVKAFIEAHLYGELSLERAAEHIGVTPNYLSRLFKLSTGVTFIDYATGRKLEAAAALLRENRYTVGEIALRLGYQSPNHFIRIFKEKYGLTPKQFRKAGGFRE